MDELDPETARQLAAMRQAGRDQRDALRESMDNSLAASAAMVTQLAAMDIAKLSANPFFPK